MTYKSLQDTLFSFLKSTIDDSSDKRIKSIDLVIVVATVGITIFHYSCATTYKNFLPLYKFTTSD